MAVKKPIYRYQYKPTAATYFKPALGEKEQLAKSVGTQVTNLEQRFKNVGIPTETGAKEVDQRNIIEKALNLKADQNMLMDVLEVLNRPTQAVTNLLSSLGEQDKRDALTAAWQGLSGQKEIGARQALANLTGDKNILKIKEDRNTKLDDIGQFVIDLGLEIVADPTTWISGGLSAAAQAKKKLGQQLLQKGLKAPDKIIWSVLGGVDDVLDPTVAAGYIQMIDNPEKLKLLKEAGDLLKPKQSLASKVMSKIDINVREFTRKAVRGIKNPEQARKAIAGLRTLKNISLKVRSAFDAFDGVKAALRGQLDSVFGTANKGLRVLKANVEGLDKLTNDLIDIIAPGADAATRKGLKGGIQEVYEAGYEIAADGTLLLSKGKVPISKLRAVHVAEDLGDSAKNYQYVSRGVGSKAFGTVEQKVQQFVTDVNTMVGEGRLKYTYKTTDDGISYFTLRLDMSDLETLTDAAKQAEISDILGAYRDVLNGGEMVIELGQSPLSKYGKQILQSKGENVGRIFALNEEIYKNAEELMGATVAGVSYKPMSLTGAEALGDVRYVRRVRTAERLAELSAKNMFEPNPLMRELVSGTGKELNERLYRGTAREYNDVLKMFYNAKDDRFAQDLVESATDFIKVAESRFSMSEATRLIFGLDAERVVKFNKIGVEGSGVTAKGVDQSLKQSLVKNLPEELQKEAIRQGFQLSDLITYDKTVKFSQASWAQDSQFLKRVDGVLDESNPITYSTAQLAQKERFQKIAKEAKQIGLDEKAKKALQKESEILGKLNLQDSEVVTREMAKEFARKNPNHKILDGGFLEVDKVTDAAGKVKYNLKGGEFKTLVESLPKELQSHVIEYLEKAGMLGKNMSIHQSAYEILKNAQNAYKVNINVGVAFFDKFLNFWKSVTLLSPSFHIRNFLGNWTNMSLSGLNADEILSNTTEAWTEIVKREEILKKIVAGTATDADKAFLASGNIYVEGLTSARRGVRDLENLAELERVSPNIKGKFSGKLKGTYNKLVQGNFKFAERADEVQRLAMFKALRKKGLSEAQAIQRVREVLFDYGKLTGFEKDVMKRFFPFYTFMKENMQFQMKNMLQNSGRYKNLFRGYKHYLEEVADLDEKDIPKYMTGNMWVPLPFVIKKDDKEAISMLKLNLPASDFLEFVEDPLKKAASSIAVPIKFGWEALTGVDTFTGSPIQQFPGQRSLDTESDSLFKFLRNEKGDFDITKNPFIKKFSDDLGLRTLRRPLTAIMDSIDTILGRQDIKTGLFDVLEQTGITTTVKKEDINLTALYQQLEYLRNLKKLYEQNTGQELPTKAQSAGYQFKPK